MSIKLIIFDFDGTLGDTRRNIVTTMQMTIKEMQLPERSSRIEREKRTVRKMIELYCRQHLHQDTMPEEYQHLADFACRRLDHCKYGEQKTACKDCPTHCYAPKEREKIREVMRWAGPRMIWYAPKDAILHILKK